MKILKKMLILALSLCFVSALAVTPAWADTEYTYTVRIFSGAHGTIDGQEVVVYKGLHYGDRVTFNQNRVAMEKDSKHYIRGIRESGKDNNTVSGAASFVVTGDQDYVVAYGVLGNAVAYTVNYVDEDGNTLAPSETYYGNVGDKVVIAFAYIENYLPEAYNQAATLKENAAENVFNFTYRKASAAAAGAAEEILEAEGGAGGADAAANAAAVAAAAEVDGLQPDELVTIDDEETPLANLNLGGDFAKLLVDLPAEAKAGICSAIVLIMIGIFLLMKRKRKQENA